MSYFASKNTRGMINQWITQRLGELLGFEDEVVNGLVVAWLDEEVWSGLFLSLPFPSLCATWVSACKRWQC